ncbi:MAG: DegV family protein [Oscillospiraceae bacterium]|nr:DegV family protein [Oscillospiraceae bacterium]
MFQIISDGGCDFTKDEAVKYNVDIVPFYVSFDHVTYLKAEVEISKEDYFDRLIAEKDWFPKTSQPNPQDYIDVYTPHLEAGRDILSLTISSKLSGSHNSAVLAANMLKEEYPDRTITLVDSLSVSMGQGLLLREIIKMRDAGRSLGEIAALAEQVRSTLRVYFTLDSLEYLKRGGRIGPTTALVGGIFGLCPILQLEEGQVTQLDNVRGKKRVLKLIEEAIVDALQDEADNIALGIGHIRNEAYARAFQVSTEAALGMKIETPIIEIGVTIGAHAGPGALGFAYCKKYDALSNRRVDVA